MATIRPRSGGDDPHPEPPGYIPPAPPGSGGGGSNVPGAYKPAAFVDPSFYRTPSFPYANLAAQLQDALGLSSRGAGVYANQQYGKAQHIKNMPANLGGGLLGMSAYARGIGVPPGGGGGGGPPPGGYPPAGGGGPGGGPVPPGGYAPGQPMPRPNPYPVMPPPGPGSNRPPGASPLPWSRANPPPPGGGLLPPAGAAPPSRGTPAGGLLTPPPSGSPGVAAGGAPLPYTPGAQFNPGAGGAGDIGQMMKDYNALPPERRGDFINAVDQWGAAFGGPKNIGAALQQALRAQMGQGNFDNWYQSNVTNKQGSGISSLAGLPSYLQGIK